MKIKTQTTRTFFLELTEEEAESLVSFLAAANIRGAAGDEYVPARRIALDLHEELVSE